MKTPKDWAVQVAGYIGTVGAWAEAANPGITDIIRVAMEEAQEDVAQYVEAWGDHAMAKLIRERARERFGP